MKFFVLFIALTGLVFLSSCEKHNRLITEVKRIEAEVKQSYEEMAVIDSKTAAFGADSHIAIINLERQNTDWTRKNAAIEAELATQSKKCTDGEAAVKEFRPKVDAYKAKYFR
ncbi:MAG: hypothetical protein ACO1TE_28840 [Prosthecobacter sp.]